MIVLIACVLAIDFRALAEIESGNDPAAVGSRGEVTEYQIMPAVWRSYTTLPARKADRAMRLKIARKHANWLVEGFVEVTRRGPSPAEFYALWNLGLHGFARRGFDLRRVPTSTKDAAVRFANLTINK